MLNSSEEISYWYLRLNGYFLLDNFVIHKSDSIDYTSDADLLALRMPFVYEEIGGQSEDWDKELTQYFDGDSIKGIICQVKGGAIGNKELFKDSYLEYSLNRFGFTNRVSKTYEKFSEKPVVTFENELGQKCQIAKLLITRDEPKKDANYLWITLKHVYNFIEERIAKYPKEKYADRNFFSSISFQTIIEMNNLKSKE